MKPKRKIKRKITKSNPVRHTFRSTTMSNDLYHADRKDSKGNLYLSSSNLKGAINGALGFPDRSQFGTMFHFIVEQTLKSKGKAIFQFFGRQEFKKARPGVDIPKDGIINECSDTWTIIDTPANIKHYQQLQRKTEKVFDEHFKIRLKSEKSELLVEESFFTDITTIRDFQGITNPLLLSFHSFIANNNISLKTRPDLVIIHPRPQGRHIEIVDWKTTSKDCIEDYQQQICFTYKYAISLYFYLLNLYYHGIVTSEDTVFFKIVMFNKTLVEIPVTIFEGKNGIFEGHVRKDLQKLAKKWYGYSKLQTDLKKKKLDFIVYPVTKEKKDD